ncbi:putative ribonuclease H-like domain-containing protein [Tanacetum coccineum]
MAVRTMLVDFRLPITFWAEVVNTACYVLNRVLITKPHNKTPYELIRGRPPLIEFMKPFRCPVTILNTRDHLGKFDGKSNEGYFVRYYMVSKSMMVFNKRTRIVEETLDIKFLENAPNVKGNGPDWIFDVYSLTNSMNYVPVVEGNLPNDIAGTRDNFVAGQAKRNTQPEQEYILIPICIIVSLISQGPKVNDQVAGVKPIEVNKSEDDIEKKSPEVDDNRAINKDGLDDQDIRSEFERLIKQEKESNSTNSINTVSTLVNTAGPSFTADDPSSPVNAAGSFSPFKYVFELPSIQNVILIDDLEYLKEPKKVIQALADPSWVEAIQDELQQFKLLNVWTLVDLPKDKWAIGTKWVFRNKKDERGIVVINKARLVGQGHTQEEGIDYNEVFALVARIEAIRFHENDILLVQIYVDDIIFGSTKKEMSVEFEQTMHRRFQMSYMGELTFFLGLQVKQKDDEIFISQDKYEAETVKTASTPIELNKPLLKDEEAKYVDVHLYRSMIGSFMYLTSFRPDIMYAVCACARFQVTPKYPKDSPFNLEAFLDSDYVGASLDRKSTTGGYQFLSKRLISWQCKKQTIVANSTNEAEYVAAAIFYG